MGKTGYEKCQELYKDLKDKGIVEISTADLRRIIALSIGIDKRTISNYQKTMVDFGFLKQTAPHIWKVA